MLVRHEAAVQVGFLDPDFFVYSEEVDFQKRLRDAGWRILHVPAARAIHHEQLATDRSAGARRVVQFHRGRAIVNVNGVAASAGTSRCARTLTRFGPERASSGISS